MVHFSLHMIPPPPLLNPGTIHKLLCGANLITPTGQYVQILVFETSQRMPLNLPVWVELQV